jgi:hypothetical protein
VFECEFFKVSWEEYDKYIAAYPGVNVNGEFKKMQVWLEANPARRKKNVKRFIVNWLAKTHGRLLEKEVEVMLKEDIRRSRVPM